MINASMFKGVWPTEPLDKAVEFLDHIRKPVTKSNRIPGPYPYYGANGKQDSVADYLFNEPLILLAEDGGHFGDPTKKIAYRVSGKCWVNNHAHVLRPREGYDIDFLCRILEKYNVLPYVNGTTRLKLTKARAKRIPIPKPSLPEQIRIVSLLSRVEGTTDKRKKSIQMLDKLLKSVFQDMFGDPVRNEKDWDLTTLDKLGSLDRGVSKNRPRNAPELLGGKYPFIQTGDISNSWLYITDHTHVNGGAKVYHLAGQKCTTHSLIAETASAVNIQF